MTKTDHKTLKIGSVITTNNKKLGKAMWIITSDRRKRGTAKIPEMFCNAKLLPFHSGNGWTGGFTFANTRHDLSEWHIVPKEEFPELFL